MTTVALAHDYVTQRGGAERVALEFVKAFPGAPLYTTLYDPHSTFPEFRDVDVRPSWLNGIQPLRIRHRVSLPVLASVVSRTRIEADITLASSSGWAHGYSCSGRMVVYCHAPARWLYQRDRYFGTAKSGGVDWRGLAKSFSSYGFSGLQRWDARSALRADRYLANSTVTRDAIRATYGLDAEIVYPPPALGPGRSAVVPDLDDGFLLCVARLLPYKNVDLVIAAAAAMPGVQLVVAGDGPSRRRLEDQVGGVDGVRLLGRVSDEELRWLYEHCSMLVAASYEDYGLSPLEAASFGRPTIALQAGGYLDTVQDEVSGLFFDELNVRALTAALDRGIRHSWDDSAIKLHALQFGSSHFHSRLQHIVSEVLAE